MVATGLRLVTVGNIWDSNTDRHLALSITISPILAVINAGTEQIEFNERQIDRVNQFENTDPVVNV